MSSQDKKSLQTLSFFDCNLDLEAMNNEVFNQRGEPDSVGCYRLEEDKDVVMDISALMLHRHEAGYRLENLVANENLSGRFSGFWRQYASKSREA